MTSKKSLNRQRGVTLIEIMGGLLLMSLSLVLINNLAQDQVQKAKDEQVATHMKLFADAVKAYTKDNFTTITATATSVVPAKIDVSVLISGGYLPATFSTLNVEGQAICALALEPTANRLTTLVVTTGGTTLTDYDLQQISQSMGASGGALYSDSPSGPSTNIIGTGGSYNFARGSFHSAARSCVSPGSGGVNLVAGHPVMALWFDQSDYASGVLYREAIPGRPELNQMQTDLDMNGNSINNALDINATGDLSVGGNETVTGNSTAKDYSVAGMNATHTLSRAFTQGSLVTPGSLVAKPVCPAGMTPQIFLVPAMYSNRDEGGGVQAVQTWATTVGTQWRVHLRILVDSSLDTAPSSPGDGWIQDADFTKAGVNYAYISVFTKCQ